ncbi:type I ribosome-inactivating protein trichoanguina-like [Momordica charantia]|uniref:rRNA N-glycosylase n=1 Tax=Momordica charantia TaxID=3673 RepID=A0A6J1DR40_MOMCH|nr:type I ribosome-inactivating protein trichoanguina-like [Momordica charantia]
MRKLTTLSLLLAILLGPLSAEGDVSFQLSGANKKSYTNFIKQLRDAVPTTTTVCKIPVLPSTASGPKSFTFVHLTNYADQTVVVAINITNVYIVAYHIDHVSYFFDDASPEAYKVLFEGTDRKTLPYSSNYDKLQSIVGKKRDLIELGLPALSSAITNLVYYEYKSTAAALLVLIQSVAEAARYKYIEQEISTHVDDKFKPDQAIISLENNWGALSKQIQIAAKGNGQFEKPVELINPNNTPFSVTNVSSLVVTSNIKLLLYFKLAAANHDDQDKTVGKPFNNGGENFITV